jgi:ubiquinone/menaquinone biosynthesis C-methylase UbiE
MAFKKTTVAKLKVQKEIQAKIPKLLALDLGCGQNKSTVESLKQNGLLREGEEVIIKGVDNQKIEGVDVIHDLTKFPYPFKDNSVDIVFGSHFLEHLDGFERIKFFNEMYRIMKMGAKMRMIHPYYKSSRAVQDPTHKFPPICEESYLYWDRNWREANKLGHYLGNCDFEFQMFYTFMDNSWMQKNEETRTFAIRHYFNVVADLMVDLKKR